MVVGIFNISDSFAGVNDPNIDYINLQNVPAINLAPHETREMTVLIKNTSVETWGNDIVKLGTVFHTGTNDRPSAWVTDSWESTTRIASDNESNIKPLQTVEFTFSVTAPARSGVFQEYFRPVIEHSHWLKGEPIVMTFRVGTEGDTVLAEGPEKEVKVYRATQEADMLENGIVVATLPISSGASGYTTPAGTFTIMNHYEKAYSEEYKLWMPNWMALSSTRYGFKGYGFHGLPYWRVNVARYEEGKIYPGGRLYTQGNLYEGYEHLGTPASHGCVRFGVEEVKVVYDWAENGTLVTII